MLRFTDGTFNDAGRTFFSPIRRPSSRPVPGSTCISPIALA